MNKGLGCSYLCDLVLLLLEPESSPSLHQQGFQMARISILMALFLSQLVTCNLSQALGIISTPVPFYSVLLDRPKVHNVIFFLTPIHRKYQQDRSGFPNHGPPDILWLSKYLGHESRTNPLIHQALGSKSQILPEVPIRSFPFTWNDKFRWTISSELWAFK